MARRISQVAILFPPAVRGMRLAAREAKREALKAMLTWWWGRADSSQLFHADDQQSFSKIKSVNNQFSLVRAVAHGIRITCGLSPQTVTGFCHIAIQPWNTDQPAEVLTTDPVTFRHPLNRILPVSVSEMTECQWYRRVPLAALTQSPLTVVNKIIDCSQQLYRSPRRSFVNEGTGEAAVGSGLIIAGSTIDSLGSFSIDFDTVYGMANIIVAVEGAPSGSTPIVVESIVHYEGVPKATGLQVGSTAAISNPSLMTAVAHMAANTDASHDENTQGRFVAGALNQLQAGAQAAANQVLGAVGQAINNAAYAAGQAAVGYATGRAARAGLYGSGYGPTQRLMN